MLNRKPAEDRKTEIIEALLCLADRIGPDRLTTNDIAREVGVTQAAIFRHFPTKATLWNEAGEVIAGRLTGAWDRAIASGATHLERLRALINAQLNQIKAAPALPAILHSRELNVENAILREQFRGLLAQYQVHLVSSLSEMIRDGTINESIEPEDAAVLLTSLVQGVAIRWGLSSRSFALVDEGLRLFDIQMALLTNQEKQT